MPYSRLWAGLSWDRQVKWKTKKLALALLSSVLESQERREKDLLLQQVEKFRETDFGGSISDTTTSMSVEDKKALKVMESTVEMVNGQYQVALPWRHLSNNRLMAERGLHSLKRRLLKDRDLLDKYKASINDYVKKGYASRVPEAEIKTGGRPIWYLTHHPVIHPHKPGKVRVVFDCAAKYNGTSLNEQLLQGPDLTNSLVGVLTRVRQEPVALVADIEAMFHQVRMNPLDCDALRFLWWPDNDLTREPAEYRMEVHLFGGTSSPSCASFCLKTTAEDNAGDFQKSKFRSREHCQKKFLCR